MSTAPVHPDPRRSRRRARTLLAAAAVFLVALAGVCIWLIRSFVSEPAKIILLPPDMAQQARAAITPQVARDVVVAAPAGTSPSFHGKVVDAQTHEPIPDFTVHLGYYSGGNSAPYFNNFALVQAHGGQYKISSTAMIAARWFIRIDAPGHLPAVLEAQDKSGQQDFELQPGSDLPGTVFDPNGKPSAGATVAVALPGLNIDLNTGGLSVYGTGPTTKTDSDGRFDLPPQIGPITIAAFDASGYGQVVLNDVGPSAEVRLARWGSVHGLLMIAGKPAAKQRVTIQANTMLSSPGQPPYVNDNDSTTTDADGHFRFARVLPGQLMVARQVRIARGSNRFVTRITQSQTVDLAAGRALDVKLGGSGRLVTGKIILPRGAGSLTNYFLNGSVTGQSSAQWVTLPPQMPDKLKTGSQAARDMWMQIFTLTPAGRQFLAAHPPSPSMFRQYAIEPGAGDTFRIEDVAPGDYHLYVYLYTGQGGRALGPANIEFTVPPIPGGGYSDVPEVLPDITLAARGQ